MNEAIFFDYNKPLRSRHMNLDFPKNGLREWGENIYKSIIFAHSELVPNGEWASFHYFGETKKPILYAALIHQRNGSVVGALLSQE